MDLEDITDKIFEPFFLSCANFTAFALVFLYGISTSNQPMTYASLGFFIAGACMGVLIITNNWIIKNEAGEPEQAQYTVKEGGKDAMQSGKNKIFTTIEM